MGTEPAGARIRFGVFEADLRRRKLWRDGTLVRLQEKPFLVLEALLECPGELLAREELHKRLWPDGTFVEYEDGLNAAVARLRQALRDSGASPRFVQTVPRQGYRFIAPISTGVDRDELHARFRRARVQALAGWLGLALAAAALGALLATQRAADQPTEGALRVARTRPLTRGSGLEGQPDFSNDAKRLAYASDQLGQMDVWVRQLSSSRALALTADHAGHDGSPRWSPDGEWVAYVSERDGGGIDVVPALGGAPRRVASLPFAPSSELPGSIPTLAWSPDASRIAVAHGVAGMGGLFVVPATGGKLRPVEIPAEVHAFAVVDPTWSPDSSRIALAALSGAARTTSRIWTVAADGSDALAVTEGASLDRQPVWVDDPPRLFFVSDRGGTADVWSVAVDPRGRPLAAPSPVTAGADVGSIAVSRRGERLAYSKVVERSNIWSTPFTGPEPVAWRDAGPVSADNQRVEWLDVSPDGEWIAFDSDRGGDVDLWVMRRDGSELRRVTRTRSHEWHPSFSPDGRRLAYHSLRDGNRDIFVVAIDGGVETRLTRHPERDWLPDWSPDGEWIVFGSDRAGSQDVYLVPSAGGEPRALVSHPANDHNPLWSPDATRVVFASNRGGSDELYAIPPDGGEPRRLTNQGWADVIPLLWPTGADVIYAWARGANSPSRFVAVRVGDDIVREVIAGPGRVRSVVPALASDGRTLYFPVSERVADLWLAELNGPDTD